MCAAYDVAFGEQVSQDVLAGKYNIKYQPVNTVKAAYQYASTSATLVAAQKVDAQTWMKFHNALLSYFNDQYNSGKGTVVQDLSASATKVKEIAAQAGIPQDVIDTFPENGVNDYLTKSTNAWAEAKIDGRENGSLGTPEFVVNDKAVVDFKGVKATSVKDFYPVITAQLQAAGPASASK